MVTYNYVCKTTSLLEMIFELDLMGRYRLFTEVQGRHKGAKVIWTDYTLQSRAMAQAVSRWPLTA
jgi:hypothetical protein